MQTGIAAVVVLAFYIAGKDPYLEMFTWLIALGGLGLMVLMAATSIAAVRVLPPPSARDGNVDHGGRARCSRRRG